MGYLFAFIGIFCGATKGFCGKKTSDYTSDLQRASYANFLRMLICILVGFVFSLAECGISGFNAPLEVILTAALSGIATSVFVISWLFAVRRGAYMLVDVFLTLGVILPIILSLIFYGEPIDKFDVIGFSLLLIATLVLFSYSNKAKQKVKLCDVLLLALSGLANGAVSFSQKMFIHSSSGTAASVFNFYTYIFSAFVLGICFVILNFKSEKKQEIKKTPLGIYVYIAIMALCLFGTSYFNTLAAERLSSAQLYPLCQGCAIILSTAMAAVFFKEKVNAKLLIGIGIAFAGLLIMNLL